MEWKRHTWIGFLIPMIVVAHMAQGQELRSPQRDDPARTAREAHVRPYTTDIFRATEANDAYRRVLFTGEQSQLVVMSIPPGESIGVETHPHVEQTIVILSGTGQAILDGAETNIGGGDVVVITPGTKHNVVNNGTTPLQLFTTYVPPNHIDGRVHQTKADAERDVEDQRFGRGVE